MGRVGSQGLMVSWTGKTSFLVPLLHNPIPCPRPKTSRPLIHHLAWLQGHWTHLCATAAHLRNQDLVDGPQARTSRPVPSPNV